VGPHAVLGEGRLRRRKVAQRAAVEGNCCHRPQCIVRTVEGVGECRIAQITDVVEGGEGDREVLTSLRIRRFNTSCHSPSGTALQSPHHAWPRTRSLSGSPKEP
jgi:hypothetical protein